SGRVIEVLGAAVVGTGLTGVLCSIMIYQCTRRPTWNGVTTTLKFGLTTLWLGVATVLLISLTIAPAYLGLEPARLMQGYGALLCRSLLVIAAFKLLYEASLFGALLSRPNTPF